MKGRLVMNVTVRLTKKYRVQLFIAIQLMRIACWIGGLGFTWEDEEYLRPFGLPMIEMADRKE